VISDPQSIEKPQLSSNLVSTATSTRCSVQEDFPVATFAKPEPVQISHLAANPFQPRLSIDVGRLAPLVESIKEFGFIGHLEARHDPADPQGCLQIVFGHRRVRASELAGLTTIPIAIVARSDDEMRRIAFIENISVEELTYWEQGVFLQTLKKETGWTIEEIGTQVGRAKGWVQNRLDVLRLPEGSPLRDAAQDDAVTMTSALALLNLAPGEQEELFSRLQKGEINSDDLKAMRRARNKSVLLPTDPATGTDMPRSWTSVEHARWILRHLESAMTLVRRHAANADFGALRESEQTRLAAVQTELRGLIDEPREPRVA